MTDNVLVRLTENGPVHYRSADIRCERGETITTSAAYAAYLVENHGFEKAIETCQAEKSNGEICGRELPCGYHSNERSDE